MSRPSFALCGQFSGQGKSAAKWLKKYELEIKDTKVGGKFPPSEYLSTLDALPTFDTAEWTKTSPEAIRLLAEAEQLQKTILLGGSRLYSVRNFHPKQQK